MWDIFDGDESFTMIAHGVTFLPSLTFLIGDVDVAVGATALAFFGSEFLLHFAEVLEMYGDGFIDDADGVDGVLHVGVLAAADGVFVGLLRSDAYVQVELGGHHGLKILMLCW